MNRGLNSYQNHNIEDMLNFFFYVQWHFSAHTHTLHIPSSRVLMWSDPATIKLPISHLHQSLFPPLVHTSHTVKHILTLCSSHFALSDYVQNEQIELKLIIMALRNNWNNSSNDPIEVLFQAWKLTVTETDTTKNSLEIYTCAQRDAMISVACVG